MKIKRRILAMLLTFCMVIGLLPSDISLAAEAPYATWTEVANSAQEGIDYAEDGSTITISTARGLAWFANQVNNGNTYSSKKVELANNIDLDCGLVNNYDCSDADFNTKITETNSWIPIGINKDYLGKNIFEGTFDGKGHTISGVKINKCDNTSASDSIGLFGNVSSYATVKYLGVVNSHIVGCNQVGGLIGELYYSDLTDCYFDGIVEGNYNVGGLVGFCGEQNNKISNCYVKGKVKGYSQVGGLVGYNDSSIKNCYNRATITILDTVGEAFAGSLVGANMGQVEGCYTLNSSYSQIFGYMSTGSDSNNEAMWEAIMISPAGFTDALVNKLNGWVRGSNTLSKLWKNGADGYPVFDYGKVAVLFHRPYTSIKGTRYVSKGDVCNDFVVGSIPSGTFSLGYYTKDGRSDGDWGSIFTKTTPVYEDMEVYNRVENITDIFTITLPPSDELIYSGTQKHPTVTVKSGYNLVVTDIYYESITPPIDAKTYNFRISGKNLENDELFGPSSHDTFKITIEKKDLTVTVDDVIINKGQSIPELNVKVEGFVNGESADTLTGFTKPTASVSGTVNTLNPSIKEFSVNFTGGNATKNYRFNPVTKAKIRINTVDVTEDDFSTNGKDLSIWQKDNIILLPVGDYIKISDNETNWKDYLLLSKEGENSQTFYLKKADGTVTESKTISYKLDKTPPTDIKIQYNKNGFKSFLNTITFGVFFKDKVEVTAKATDALSGVKSYQYYAADSEISDVSTITDWQDSLTLTENSKKIIYIKVTDNVGNEVITNNEGVVVYSDSTVTPDSTIFDKDPAKQEDITITMNTNGNTLREMKHGDTTLKSGTDYVVNGNTVCISKTYLNTFKKDTKQTLTFVFNPMGIENASTTSKATVDVSIMDTHNHQWDEGTVTTPATVAKEGVITYTCTICGETKTDSIAKLAPTIIDGANNQYTKGEKEGITFRSDAELEDLIRVTVDGKELSKDMYTAKSGSTIITLKPEYLETLSAGTHTISIHSNSGTASTEFTIEENAVDPKDPEETDTKDPKDPKDPENTDSKDSKDTDTKDADTKDAGHTDTTDTTDTDTKKPDKTDTKEPGNTNAPKTGDTGMMELWIALLCISGGVLTTLQVVKKYRKHSS